MSKLKICSKCHEAKDADNEFYNFKSKYRSECKKCTIKRNVIYQKVNKSWKSRYKDDDTRRAYMREYYNKNKEKYATYRNEFKTRYPLYYREYFKTKKRDGS